MSAPDPEPTDQEEPDGPTEDSLQRFAWNFLSRFSHLDEARDKLDRQTEEEHINEKEMVCVCICVRVCLCAHQQVPACPLCHSAGTRTDQAHIPAVPEDQTRTAVGGVSQPAAM